MNRFEYLLPESFEAAVTLLAQARPQAAPLVKAGGIDVLDRLKEGLEAPRRVLNLLALRNGAAPVRRASAETIEIDALATLAEVAGHELIRKLFPALAQAAGHTATPQIRNVATVAGNLCQKPRCWYFRSQDYTCLKKGGSTCYAVEGDNRYHAVVGAGACHIVHPSNLAPVLLTAGARIGTIAAGPTGPTQRTIAIDEFFRVPADPRDDEHTLRPGELIQTIELPTSAGGPRAAYVELREKQSFDWPLVSCAANLNDPANPRVVLGAVAPIPWRVKVAERVLAGSPLDDRTIDRAARLAAEGCEPMSRNAYKVELVAPAVADALRQARDRGKEESGNG